MTIIIKNKERLIYGDFLFKCCVGKKGLTNKKKEGGSRVLYTYLYFVRNNDNK